MATKRNTHTGRGRPPLALISAARGGILESVKNLARDEDIDCPDKNGSTALSAAAENGHYEVARYLADIGATLVDNDSRATPMHEFARRGWGDLVERAIEQGQDPFAGLTESGLGMSTPLGQAVMNGHLDVVRKLASAIKHSPGEVGPLLGALLHSANSSEMIDALLDFGADIDHQLLNKTALFASVEKRSAEMCATLARRGADLERRWCGFTALYYAGMHDEPGTMLVLLEAGAKEEACGVKGQCLEDLVPRKVEAGPAYAAWKARNAMRAVTESLASRRANNVA